MAEPFLDRRISSSGRERRRVGSPVLSVPFWGDEPGLWDAVIVEGRWLPGVCQVRGQGFEQRVNKVKARGRHGSTQRYVGKGDVDFEILVRLWTAQHLEVYLEIVELVTHAPLVRVKKTVRTRQPVPVITGIGRSSTVMVETVKDFYVYEAATGPRTIEVYHPSLAMFGVRQATVMDIGLLSPTEGGDVMEAVWHCSQLHLGKRDSGTGDKKASEGTGNTGGITTSVRPQPSTTLTGP